MRFNRCLPSAISLSSLLLGASLAHAQMAAPSQLTPRISHIMPMGGQAGTTFDLKITGQDLNDVEDLYFSFPGTKAEAVSSEVAPVEKKGKPAPPLKTH